MGCLIDRRSLEIIQSYFKSYSLDKQDLLEDEDKWNKVLALITDESILYLYLSGFVDGYTVLFIVACVAFKIFFPLTLDCRIIFAPKLK